MVRNQLEVFWTISDLVAVLNQVAKKHPISYAVSGMFSTDSVQELASPTEISTFVAASNDVHLSFLAFESGGVVAVEDVPQRRGGLLYSIGQLRNPRTVVVRPGRLIDGRTLLAGQIGTATLDPVSLDLFSIFAKAVRKQFAKVKSYWVGPEAERLLDAGGRLCATLKAPPEYDLRR